MPHRRTGVRRTALRTGAVLTAAVVAGTLTGCSAQWSDATSRDYTPAMGVNHRDGTLDVLGAVVVATEDGSGTFVATLSNNSTSDPATLTGLESTGEPALTGELSSPVEVPPRGWVNLAEEGGVEVTGDFVQGNFVPLRLSVDGADSVDLEVPVVPNAGEFAGLDGPAPPTPEAEEHSESEEH